MPNTILTPDMITSESVRVLHQKLDFVGSIDRQYDNSFAQAGAKIGSALRIKTPAKYTVRQTMARSAQDHEERNVTLNADQISGVDVDWTSLDLTLDLDDFSKQHIEPAMAVIASDVESRALAFAYKQVYNQVDNIGSAPTYRTLLQGRKKLVDNLAPKGEMFPCQLNTSDNLELVDALKGQFNPQGTISAQNTEGFLGSTAKMMFFENTLLPTHTTGTAAATSGYLVNGASQTGSTLTVDTGTNTFLEGDIITLGINRVHPETKADTGELQQFVVTADSGASATSLSISPAITATGGHQNVTGSPADNAPIVKVGAASITHDLSLAYHKNAFTFATTDLEMPSGVDMASRQVFDGISISFVRDFDVDSRDFRGRFDVLWGFTSVYPEIATRIANN